MNRRLFSACSTHTTTSILIGLHLLASCAKEKLQEPEDPVEIEDTEPLADTIDNPLLEYVLCKDQEGTRIKFEADSASEHETLINGLHDTFHGECTIKAYPNSNGEMSMVCLPLTDGGTLYYRTNNCDEAPIAYFSNELHAKSYIKTLETTDTQSIPRLHKVGNPIENAPGTLYRRSQYGTCGQSSKPELGVFFESTGLLAAEELIQFESAALSAGAIAQTQFIGEDGSKVCNHAILKDTNLQTECQFTGLPYYEESSCIPSQMAHIFEGYRDDLCQNQELFAQAKSTDTFRFGSYYLRLDECSSRQEIHHVIADTLTTYRQGNDDSCVPVLSTSWSVGQRVHENDFEKATHFIRPNSEGRLKRTFFKTDEGLLIDKRGWWDSKLETACFNSGEFDNPGIKRCIPMNVGIVYSQYSDANCQTPIDVVTSSICQVDIMKFGVSFEGETTEYWELSPRSAATYTLRNNAETNQAECKLTTEPTFDLTTALSKESFAVVNATTELPIQE